MTAARWSEIGREWLVDRRRFVLLTSVVVLGAGFGIAFAPVATTIATVAVALTALLARRPQALVFALVALMGNLKINYYAGFFTVFPEYPLIALAALIWLFRWMEDGRGIEEPGLMALFAAWMLAGLASVATAPLVARVFTKDVLIGLSLVIFYLTFTSLKDERGLMRALAWWEGSALVVAGYGVVQMVAAFHGIDTTLPYVERFGNPDFHYGVGAPVVTRITRIFRANSFFNDPNILAGYLAAAMCMTLALRFHHADSGRRGRAAFETAALGVMALAMLLTLSRSGILALISGLVVVFAFMPAVLRRGRFWIASAVGVVIAGVVAAAVKMNPVILVQRLMQSFDENDVSSRVHHEVFVFGLDLLRRFPLTGAGLGNFGAFYSREADANFPNMMSHSAPISYLSETGLVGGALFVALVLVIAWRPWRALRRPEVCAGRPGLRAALAGLLGAVVAMNVANFFYDYYLRTFIWVIAALAIAAARVAEGRSGGEEQR